jgi:hypothetical protein
MWSAKNRTTKTHLRLIETQLEQPIRSPPDLAKVTIV